MKRLLQTLVLLLAALLVPTTAVAAYVQLDDGWHSPAESQVRDLSSVGDLNSDTFVNMDDLTIMINYLLTNDATGINLENADTNLMGGVTMDDLTTLINYMLTNEWPWNDDSHEWVDLGLPSGTLWARCNVGADSPEDYGDYFAWGETEPKAVYNWGTYKWCRSSNIKLTKYCTKSSYGYNGFVDNKTELDAEDDAAYVNWGENWRMPTVDQFDELKTNCSWTWTTQNGVKGRLVTGPNGNTLFLPAAGGRTDSSLYDTGSDGYYWSRTLDSSFPNSAYGVDVYSGGVSWLYGERRPGLTVRAVRVPQN